MKPLIKEMRKRKADHPGIKSDHMKEEPQGTEAPLFFDDSEYMFFIISFMHLIFEPEKCGYHSVMTGR